MITVAQRSMYPAPISRNRFAVLTVSDEPRKLVEVDGTLRSLGATAIAQANSTHAPVPRPGSSADICILDASLGDPTAQVARLRAHGWRRIVVVAARADAEIARRALSCGVRSLIASPGIEVPARPMSRPMFGVRVHADQLSDREVQVLSLVAEGMSNRAIGQRLCLSALTVKSHLARIARKLGTGDRAEMVAIAFRSGLLE